MRVVIDTNILVSALWTAYGNPGKILDMVGLGKIKPCYDHRIISEYEEVLKRPKFMFSAKDIDGVLNRIKSKGFCIIAQESDRSFLDETDRAFYEVAVGCDAYLVTGNIKHYPSEPFIMTPSDFLKTFTFD